MNYEPMSESRSKYSWKLNSWGSFCFLLATLFVVELALMETGVSFLSSYDPVFSALLDAFLLVALFSLPLLLLLFRLKSDRKGANSSFLVLWLGILAGLFLIEVSIMFFLADLIPETRPHLHGLVDASLTLLLSTPLFWWMFRRFELSHIDVSLSDYLSSPSIPYSLLLVVIFLLGLQTEVLSPEFYGGLDPYSLKLCNAALVTLLSAPLLWGLVARPLQRSSASERARTLAVYGQVVDAVITFDSYGQIRVLNPAAQRIFGYSSDVMLKQKASLLFEDGDPLLAQLMENAVHSDGAPVHLASKEVRCFRADGSLIPMDVSISRILIHGRSEFLLIMRDVSERRRATENLLSSENRFRQLFEQSDDAILFLHPRNHSVIDVNATTVSMFGYSSPELVSGNLELIFPPAEYEKLMARLPQVGPHEVVQIDRMAGCHKDGTELMLSMRVKVMFLLDVEIFYCTLRDVTERVRMENEAREIQSKLIHTSKMTSLGLMVSGVAHEINNPNNFILSNAQLLKGYWREASCILREYREDHGDFLLGGQPFAKRNEDIKGLYEGIVEGSRRINAIVTNLKAFARQESIEKTEAVNVNHVAKTAISILHHEIGRLTTNFSFQPDTALPKVKGNRQQLGQVIVNLVMNACQALPDKSKSVLVKTFVEPESGMVIVEVRDEGAGMSAETAKLVMEPFFTTKLDSGGTGLGLSICRTIIRDHHGTLDFHSEPGVGTTFFIRLPAFASKTRDANL